VLEAIGPKALGLHLRKFCDYLASQLESCQTKQPFLQCTDLPTPWRPWYGTTISSHWI